MVRQYAWPAIYSTMCFPGVADAGCGHPCNDREGYAARAHSSKYPVQHPHRPQEMNQRKDHGSTRVKKTGSQPGLKRDDQQPKRLTCPQQPSSQPASSGTRQTTGPHGWPAASPSGRWGRQQSVGIAMRMKKHSARETRRAVSVSFERTLIMTSISRVRTAHQAVHTSTRSLKRDTSTR